MRTSLALTLMLLAAPLSAALPTPGFNGAASDATLGRIFPEALETNDYVSYAEARAGIDMLIAEAPDLLELKILGPSLGWPDPVTGAREPHDIFAVEITNEKSEVPADKKRTLVFFLSLHGNEKGGREGGFRVIEDMARGVGLAQEEPELLDMLDYQRLVLLFANADGWTHEELTYRVDPTPEQFTRGNANGTDLNRQFPTVGYLFEEYTPLSEPEAQVMVTYTKSLTNIVAGADMHGMLQNTNLVRMLLKDGEKTQQRLFENQRIAELYKERLNANPKYDTWASAPDSPGVCCGQVAEWAATFDAIGYSASGTAGAWIVQGQGLNAPGYTVEFAYNHLITDNYYPGPGAVFNDYHVEAVRDIVSVFMNYAAENVKLSVETHGKKTAVLSNAFVATNADDDKSTYDGWFTQNELDDQYDIAHTSYAASPQAYWADLARFVRDDDAVGILDSFDSTNELTRRLAGYDNLVVPGTAAARLASAPDAQRAISDWVRAGGTLLLTDDALALASNLGIAAEAANKTAYSGYMDIIERDHPLVANLQGAPRQTYDPNPLGFAPDTSPVWFVDRAAWESAGGVTVAGVGKQGTGEAAVEDPSACGTPQVPMPIEAAPRVAVPIALTSPTAASAFELGLDCVELDGTTLGIAPLGAGQIIIFGAILPNPTEEANHPYGLDDHAVAANGNLVVLNALGMEFVYDTPPAIDALEGIAPAALAPASSTDAQNDVPGPAAILALAAIAVALLLRRDRRRA